jgi:predicted secreted protein
MIHRTVSIRLAACAAMALAALPAHAETLLHLADTETVTAAPDELAVTLRAEAISPGAAEAQQKVNAMMADALAQARTVPGVGVSTSGYTVWRTGPTPQDRTERWQAGQTLSLHSHDGVALLKLVGTLQQKGLTVGQLGWQLSRDAARKADDAATHLALTALRGKADDAAASLGLRFDQFKAVRIGATPPMPMPRLTGAMPLMQSAAAPPPSVAAEDVPVSATVEADVILQPK